MTGTQWAITLAVTITVPSLTWLIVSLRWSGRMETTIANLVKQAADNGVALDKMQHGMITKDRLENGLLKMQTELREAFGREYATIREVAKLEAQITVLNLQKRDGP